MPDEQRFVLGLAYQAGPDPRIRVGADGTGLERQPWRCECDRHLAVDPPATHFQRHRVTSLSRDLGHSRFRGLRGMSSPVVVNVPCRRGARFRQFAQASLTCVRRACSRSLRPIRRGGFG